MNRRQKATILVLVLLGCLVLVLLIPPIFRLIIHFVTRFYESMDVTKGSALVVALAALFVAWSNFRRGNTAIVKIIEVSHSGIHSLGVNSERPFQNFEVTLKNVGIPLRNAAVSIHGSTHLGFLNLPLDKFKGHKTVPSDGTLEKGMVGKYGLRSFQLDATKRSLLAALIDPEASRVSIGVFSDAFLVSKFYLRPRGVRRAIRGKWNWLAWKVNFWFQHSIERWGRQFVRIPQVLPVIKDPYEQFEEFIRAVQAEAIAGQANGAGVEGAQGGQCH